MTSQMANTGSGDDWFVEPPSRLRNLVRWSTAKAAAGIRHLHGNLYADGFGILMYHRVAEHISGVERPTLNVTPLQLLRQLSGLLSRGFECWPLTKLVAAHHESRPVPSHVFAVTFDDGYGNNFTNALPILRELKVPATIFLATKYLDTDRPFPFDNWSASGSGSVPPVSWRPLSLTQCDNLLASGLVEFGAHTHSHQRFVRGSADFRSDMTTCLDFLSRRFGVNRPTFAYPYGETNQDLVDTARQLDIACAVTTQRRCVRATDDLFQWGRFDAHQCDTSGMVAGKLSGWYPKLVATAKTLARPLTSTKPVVRRQRDRKGEFCDTSLPRKAPSHP